MAQKLKLLRERRGLSQRELAKAAQVSEDGIFKIEANKLKNRPKKSTIKKFARFFGLKPSFFVDSRPTIVPPEILKEIVPLSEAMSIRKVCFSLGLGLADLGRKSKVAHLNNILLNGNRRIKTVRLETLRRIALALEMDETGFRALLSPEARRRYEENTVNTLNRLKRVQHFRNIPIGTTRDSLVYLKSREKSLRIEADNFCRAVGKDAVPAFGLEINRLKKLGVPYLYFFEEPDVFAREHPIAAFYMASFFIQVGELHEAILLLNLIPYETIHKNSDIISVLNQWQCAAEGKANHRPWGHSDRDKAKIILSVLSDQNRRHWLRALPSLESPCTTATKTQVEVAFVPGQGVVYTPWAVLVMLFGVIAGMILAAGIFVVVFGIILRIYRSRAEPVVQESNRKEDKNVPDVSSVRAVAPSPIPAQDKIGYSIIGSDPLVTAVELKEAVLQLNSQRRTLFVDMERCVLFSEDDLIGIVMSQSNISQDEVSNWLWKQALWRARDGVRNVALNRQIPFGSKLAIIEGDHPLFSVSESPDGKPREPCFAFP